MSITPFITMPQDLREWSRYLEQTTVTANAAAADAIDTAAIQDEAVTLSKVGPISANKVVGATVAGSPTELAGSDVVGIVEGENWAFTGDVDYSTGTVKFNGSIGFYGVTPIAQPAAVADASTAHALNVVFDDTEVEAALDALGTTINAIIARLEALGLIAT